MEVIMKKYWWVIVLLGLLVVAGGLIYFVTTDFEEEIQLLEEMEEVYALMDEHNTDELNQKLDTIISTGDYAVVEKAAKNYTRDLYNVVTNISNELANDRIMRLTTYENFQNDGPEFTESKAYIIETKEKLENYKTAYQEHNFGRFVLARYKILSSRDMLGIFCRPQSFAAHACYHTRNIRSGQYHERSQLGISG